MANPLAQFIGTGLTVMGKAALDRARAAGYTDAQIKQLAAQNGILFGDAAAAELGVPSNTQIASSGNPLLQFAQPGSTILGLAAVDRARAAGYSDQQIRDLAAKNGMTFAAAASSSLGTSPATAPAAPSPATSPKSSNPLAQFIGTGLNVMGQAALDRARAAGYTDAQIKALAAQNGIQFGDQAAQALGVPSSTQVASSSNPLLQFAQPGSTALGLAAVDRARAAGYTDQQIRDLAAKNGMTFGTAASQSLGLGGSASAAGTSSSSTPSVASGSSSVPGAQQGYQQTLQNASTASGTSAADAYKNAFNSALLSYGGSNAAQQSYESALKASSTSTNQAGLAEYQKTYDQAIQGLSTPSTGGEDYSSYLKDYQSALKNYDANNQATVSSAQSAYEAATRSSPSPSSNTEYKQMYDDLLKKTTDNYNSEIGRYQSELTKTQSEANKAKSERDAAVDRANLWEKRSNEDDASEANEALRGIRSGSTSSGGPGSANLASGQAAYSVGEPANKNRSGVTVGVGRGYFGKGLT